MGFGDKLKGLREQAQQAVVENKDKIQGAVQSAGEVANIKTHGKYADKIAKVGDKVTASVDKFGDDAQTAGTYDVTTVAEVPEAPDELHHPPHAPAAAADAPAAATAGSADATAGSADATATAAAEPAEQAGAPASSPPDFE
jgi:hypothetical protein